MTALEPPEAFTYGPWDPEVLQDPYPHFARLRAESPVHHVAEHDIWVVSRYDDLVAAARPAEAEPVLA